MISNLRLNYQLIDNNRNRFGCSCCCCFFFIPFLSSYFFLCLFFKHFTTISRPSFCHAHFSNRVPIHTCIHTRFTCAAAVFIFVVAAAAALVFLSQVSVCVFFSPAFIFCWFSFFFITLPATFRLIKDNSVIIIVFFSLPFLLLLYSAVYVWVFRLFVFVSPLFMVYYKKLSHCLLLWFNFITSPLLYHFYSKYTTWFYLLYYDSRIQLSAYFCAQYLSAYHFRPFIPIIDRIVLWRSAILDRFLGSLLLHVFFSVCFSLNIYNWLLLLRLLLAKTYPEI